MTHYYKPKILIDHFQPMLRQTVVLPWLDFGIEHLCKITVCCPHQLQWPIRNKVFQLGCHGEPVHWKKKRFFETTVLVGFSKYNHRCHRKILWLLYTDWKPQIPIAAVKNLNIILLTECKEQLNTHHDL